VAQNEEQIVVEEELTSYTSESAAPSAAAAQASRPALTGLDNGTSRQARPIGDCVLRPGRTSPPND